MGLTALGLPSSLEPTQRQLRSLGGHPRSCADWGGLGWSQNTRALQRSARHIRQPGWSGGGLLPTLPAAPHF